MGGVSPQGWWCCARGVSRVVGVSGVCVCGCRVVFGLLLLMFCTCGSVVVCGRVLVRGC